MLPSSAARNSVGVVRVVASKDTNPSQANYNSQPNVKYSDPLKAKYTEINDILNGNVGLGQLVNIRGVAKDVQLPMKSGGSDWKMAFRLADEASEASNSEVRINLFTGEHDMPTISAYDIVYVLDAKVQSFGGGFSLLSHYSTSTHIFSYSTISKADPAAAATCMLWTRKKGVCPEPLKNDQMVTEARALYKRITAATEANGTDVSAQVETIRFESAKSGNVRDKRSLLKDVSPRKFYDLLVRIVSEPRSSGDVATFWVTDYTVNDGFSDKGRCGFFADFEKDTNGTNTKTGTVGDEYGYLDKFTSNRGKRGAADADDKWKGPLGRRSMLVSCYNEHRTAIMDYARLGSWVKLANVEVRFGKNSGFLEGFQNSDARAYSSRIHVDVIDEDDLDVETMDPRQLEALKRQDVYEKSRKNYIKETTKRVQKQQAGRKRAAEGGAAENSKQRRQRLRMEKQKDGGGGGGEDAMLGEPANRAIACEAHMQPITPFSDVCRLELYRNPDSKNEYYPFVNIKFAAKVRVVDYTPNRLEDFAVSRYIGQLEQAGYVGDGDSSSSDEDEDAAASVFGFGRQAGALKRHITDKLIWEWQFAFLLEDASEDALTHEENGAQKSQIWVVVDNEQGQALLDIDACDLKNNKDDLEHLRHKMFLLWGNLEEVKREKERRALAATARASDMAKAAAGAARRAAQQEQQKIQKQKQQAEAAKKDKEAKAAQKAQKDRERKAAIQAGRNLSKYAPDCSSDEETVGPTPSRAEASQAAKPTAEIEVEVDPEPEVLASEEPLPAVSNLPFVCCIRQYGIQERVKPQPRNDGDMDVDSDGGEVKRRWRQMFGMFGTKIKM